MGRGSSKAKYGTEYSTIFTDGNVKFIKSNSKSSSNPRVTKTSGRVYAVVNSQDKLKSIVYFDKNNNRRKEIDLDHPHKGMKEHTHYGYNHTSKKNGKKGATNLTTEEKNMVDRVKRQWYKHQNS